ncbi:MAG: tetratricopeptide repeat protein, partial [Chitinophagaceae bacterium]|nr:tetratricopeptide repeat protein [Chitinophagaceae bacterium]
KAQSSVDIIGSPTNFTFLEQLVIGFNGLFFYLKSTLFPYKLSTLYIYPDSISGAIYLKAIVSILISIFIILYFKKEKSRLYSYVLFFVCVLPVLQFLPVGNAIYADRYYYIPSIGLFLLIAFFIKNISSTANSKTIFYICFACSLLFSYLSFSQVKVWENSFTLWNQVRNNYPKTPSAWYNTGNYFMNLETPDYKSALPFFVEATNLKVNYPKAFNNMGVCYYNLNNYQNALKSYSIAYSLDSSQADLAINVGKANDMLTQYQNAIVWYNKALKLKANKDVIYYNIGITNFKMGNIDSSIYFYEKAIKINAKNPEFYNNLGTSLIYKKEYLNAIKNYDLALLLNQKYSEPYFNKALTLQVLGDTLKMIENFKIAAKLGHNQAQLFLSQNKINY